MYFSELDCTDEQLEKKFNKLAKTGIPKGDPNMPENICKARAVCELIIEKLMVQLDLKRSCSHKTMIYLKFGAVAEKENCTTMRMKSYVMSLMEKQYIHNTLHTIHLTKG